VNSRLKQSFLTISTVYYMWKDIPLPTVNKGEDDLSFKNLCEYLELRRTDFVRNSRDNMRSNSPFRNSSKDKINHLRKIHTIHKKKTRRKMPILFLLLILHYTLHHIRKIRSKSIQEKSTTLKIIIKIIPVMKIKNKDVISIQRKYHQERIH